MEDTEQTEMRPTASVYYNQCQKYWVFLELKHVHE
jgi:hypothetical protein